jgi:hypothetical protein
MPFEQREGLRVESLCLRGVLERLDERPATSSLRRAERGEPSRPAATRAGPGTGRALPAERPQRCERVVGDLAGPDEIPQSIEHLATDPPPAAAWIADRSLRRAS